ncbi:MAG TPA: glucosamine-6-phosphate deaminase [Vicinamibacteria bacterium]|nr:glucosamine-6-phosphate deaminase [Vicinamibacteria bacterium]
MIDIRILPDKRALGAAAAAEAAAILADAIARQGHANVVAATGASQFEFLDALASAPGIAWKKAVFFHLDEYVGLPDTHPASFRRYLRERIVNRVRPGTFHFIKGDAADPAAECRRLAGLIRDRPIDVAFVGIGENGHLAFNDPPADFETREPYLVVDLDEACRRQQLGEGWFKTLEDVPRRAISMSVAQILLCRRIVCVVPDARKAKAVRDSVRGGVSPLRPASALQQHGATTVYLDPDSAALL